MACYYFEAFLKVVVLFKEHCIIDDDLRRGDAEVNDAIINGFGRLSRKKGNGERIQLNINHSEMNDLKDLLDI